MGIGFSNLFLKFEFITVLLIPFCALVSALVFEHLPLCNSICMFGLLVPCVLKTCFFCVFQIGAANAIKRKAVPVTPEPETDNERPPPGLPLPAAKRQRSTDDPHMLALMSKTDTLSVVLQDMATRNQTPPPAPAPQQSANRAGPSQRSYLRRVHLCQIPLTTHG